MAVPEQLTRILVLSEDADTRDVLSGVLEATIQFEYYMPDKAGEMLAMIAESKPGILILDYSEGIASQIDVVTTKHPYLAIIVFMAAADAVYANDVMLAGARAFVLMPATAEVVLNTLNRVAELQTRFAKLITADEHDDESDDHNFSFVVFSPRGGAGTSTLAVNLAVGLKQAAKNKQILLVDGKLMFGDVDLMMNIKTHNTIADLLPYADNLDEMLIRNVINEHVSGVDVLVGPATMSMAERVQPENLYTLLLNLQDMYSYMVVDGGSGLNENAVTLMDASFRVIVPFMPDLASLRDVQRFLEVTTTLNYPRNKIMLVLNQSKVKGGISVDEIESVLQWKLAAVIPYDSPNVLRSLNKGLPILLDNSRSAASKAVQGLVSDLLGQVEVEKADQDLYGDSQQSMLHDSSRLG